MEISYILSSYLSIPQPTLICFFSWIVCFCEQNKFFFKYFINLSCKATVLWAIFKWKPSITDLVFLIISLLIFSASSGFNLVGWLWFLYVLLIMPSFYHVIFLCQFLIEGHIVPQLCKQQQNWTPWRLKLRNNHFMWVLWVWQSHCCLLIKLFHEGRLLDVHIHQTCPEPLSFRFVVSSIR